MRREVIKTSFCERSISTAILALIFFLSFSTLTIDNTILAATPTAQQAEQVCQNWLTQIVHDQGQWAGDDAPKIDEIYQISQDGVVLANCYTIVPRGFIVVPLLTALPPVKIYSDEDDMIFSDSNEMLNMIREVLTNRFDVYNDIMADASKSAQINVVLQKYEDMWDRYTLADDKFAESLADKDALYDEAGPLTTSSWHQHEPYNNDCPTDGDGKCVVGCTATALSQLLYYWQWPVTGRGSHTYTWYNSYCGYTIPPTELSADFSDAYDWANIVDSCDQGCTTAQEEALANLCYEAGVSVNMDYGNCGSAAGQSPSSMINYLRYSPEIQTEDRADYDMDGWFSIIKSEIDLGRPMLYGINSHSIICDGYRDLGSGLYQYHMNYGWGQSNNAWYFFDELFCSWISGSVCPSEQDMLISHIYPQDEPYIYMVSYGVDDAAGDADGHADVGESITLEFTVESIGTDATNVTGELTTDDSYLTVTSSTTDFASSMTWTDQATSQTPFEITVDGSCPDPHVALLELVVTADGGYSHTDTVWLFIGETPGFADDMESGDDNWYHSVLTASFKDQWHLETARNGGDYSWKAGRLDTLDYSNSCDACLMTKPFLLPENAQLTFSHRIDTEIGDETTVWDGGLVMLSLQDGQWFQIYPEGDYPYTMVDNAANPMPGGTPCYGASYDWAEATFDLSAYSGVVQIMFRLATDGAATEEGWYIDDVAVVAGGPDYVAGDANGDGTTNIADASYIVNAIFFGGNQPDPEDAADANCDGNWNIADASYIVNWIFFGGGAPCYPE